MRAKIKFFQRQKSIQVGAKSLKISAGTTVSQFALKNKSEVR